jgi:porin
MIGLHSSGLAVMWCDGMRGKRQWLRAVLAAAAITVTASGAHAQDKAKPQSIWEQDTFSGDWHGVRTLLANQGVTLTAQYIAEGFNVASGGIYQRSSYEGRFEFSIDNDLEKFMGWRGASTHFTVFNIHSGNGDKNVAYNVGSIADPSNIDGHATTRLFDAWFQQNFFDDRLSVRIGQLGVDLVSFTSETSGGLINGTFGWPSIFAANMINGGPAYPLAAPGVQVLVKPSEELTVMAALLSGDPAGPNCNEDPQICNPHGTTFSFSGGTLVIGELQYAINHGTQATGLPGVYKLGVWYETAEFPDQRYGLNASGAAVSLADPAVVGPLNHRGNWGVFGVIDQTVWRTQERSLSLFVRGSLSPSDRNLISSYVDGGVGFKGLLPGRAKDVLTFGVAYAKISPDAVAADQDTLAANGPPSFIRDHEVVFEVSYALQLAPCWIVQPDFQYIIHPGGNVAHPDDPTVTVGDAAIFGVRSTFTF